MIIQKSLAIALAMLFGATSGMTEPDAAKPKLSDIESWTCRTRVDLDMHFNAKIELVVRNPEDRYNTDRKSVV